MKPLTLVFALFICTITAHAEPTSSTENALPTHVAAIKQKYEENISKALQPLKARYVADLKRALDESTRSGKLDDAIAIRKEIGTVGEVLVSDPGSHSLQVLIKASVDATDEVTIANGKLSIHHIDWSLPDNISINGKRWKPKWKDNQTEEYSNFVPPLASLVGAKASIRLVKGNGEATILEQPIESNNYHLKLRFVDAGSGASDFEVRVYW